MLKQKNIMALLRMLFLAAFAILVLYGMLGNENERVYVPKTEGTPVISLTIDTNADPESCDLAAQVNTFTFGSVPAFPADSAQASAVICADTGEALYLKNADMPLPMASTTKIMTALCAIELLPTDLVFTVPPEVCGVEGSSIYLTVGERISIEDLLYGLLLESGNDAACALAVAACGNIGDFVSYMNEKARQMGLSATHFENPHGLSAEGHFTTARDLAQVTYHAMKDPLFRKICGTKSYTVINEKGTPIKYFSNHNRFLRTYNGAVGVKTGYTINSGRCLVTSAERDGTSFIAVTLNDRSDFADHARLLDHAFENYRTVHIADKGTLGFCADGRMLTNHDDICICVQKNNPSPVDADILLG